MIEVASSANLSHWTEGESPFYLEIFGEAAPVIDANFAEIFSPSATTPTPVGSSPVYEYWWTIGHPGSKPEHHDLFGTDRGESIWANLAECAARVYLYFPLDCGWRIKEVVATAKYLSPTRDQVSLSERANAEWQKLQPLISDAGLLAGALAPVPIMGVAAGIASPALTTLSKLQIGNVPPSATGYNWYVDKVTTQANDKHGVMQGVMWSIPKTMFESLGGRLTGSLAVSFIQSVRQTERDATVKAGAVMGHACVYTTTGSDNSASGEHWVPGKSSFVRFSLAPTLPK